MTQTTAILISLAFTYICFRLVRAAVRNQTRRLPPGPPAKPLVGNIFQVPLADGAWTALTQFKEKYGDIVGLYGLGNNVVVLNSLQVINDLLDKRGKIYSHRPIFTVVGELMGLNQSFALIPYGKEWREHRKMANMALNPAAVKQYHGVQEDIVSMLTRDLLEKPDDFFEHIGLAAARIVLVVSYGMSISNADLIYVTHAKETMEMIARSTVPGAFICDFLPILKHLPSWFPFHREAVKGKKMIETFVTMPFEKIKSEMAEGIANPSLAQDLLSTGTGESLEHRVKWITGSMFGAGGETTYATTLTFIMAMALHPEKQKLAQAELDRVVGTERMPVMADLPNLQYVNAVIKESMRWHPPLPLGVARRCGQDDFYEGYFIPKDTIVLANAWAVSLEPNEKYDPHSFLPERFLDPSVSVIDPAKYVFGFGRRVCPGIWLGENNVFIIFSTILASFDISPPAEGELVPHFGTGLVSYPEPFKCRIIPRSAAKAELIQLRAAQCAI